MDETVLLSEASDDAEGVALDDGSPPPPPIPDRSELLIGGSPAMRRLLERISAIGSSDARVLVTGESGSGKELVTRLLHDESARRSRPFVAVNCAAFPEALLESELFGHERGAFSGAVAKREGRFQAAHRGTLFLDEVAELPLPAQAKLLRVLETGTLEPLGTNQPVYVDVRVLSATHRDLRQRVHQGLFREDLYYRLRVIQLRVPPLREREGDVPRLVDHFLRELAPGGVAPSLSARAAAALAGYGYPGNVRELQNIVQQALVLSGGAPIDLHHLPEEVAGRTAAASSGTPAEAVRPLSQAVAEFEREYLRRALHLFGGRRTECARRLGVSRKTLWQKLRRHGLQGETEEGPRAGGGRA